MTYSMKNEILKMDVFSTLRVMQSHNMIISSLVDAADFCNNAV